MFATGARLLLMTGVVAAALAAGSLPVSSSVSAELARKCRSLALGAHPTQPAGKKQGSEVAQREYFRECVAKGGEMEHK